MYSKLTLSVVFLAGWILLFNPTPVSAQQLSETAVLAVSEYHNSLDFFKVSPLYSVNSTAPALEVAANIKVDPILTASLARNDIPEQFTPENLKNFNQTRKGCNHKVVKNCCCPGAQAGLAYDSHQLGWVNSCGQKIHSDCCFCCNTPNNNQVADNDEYGNGFDNGYGAGGGGGGSGGGIGGAFDSGIGGFGGGGGVGAGGGSGSSSDPNTTTTPSTPSTPVVPSVPNPEPTTWLIMAGMLGIAIYLKHSHQQKELDNT